MASSQTVEKYCSLLVRSRLMSQDEVKDSFRRWQETTKGNVNDDADSFRRFLVARNRLTDYQSHLLMRGHADGYFIDQYKILDLIGKGRMAGVYKAIHSSGQVVAVKVLPPSKAKDPTILSRFQREGTMLTKLDHDNVVRAFQLGETNGRHYIVMEHLEGEPLDEILERRKRLPINEAVRLIHQALLGLQHVFEKGMVHRDLKPANLVLIPAPTPGPGETTLGSMVKILDIGLGRATFDETTKEPDPDTHLTQDGTILGTPEYLAPEQARSAHEADIRADIYSLGCVLYHLITGQLPYPPTPGEGILQQVVRHVTETPKPIGQLVSQTPEGLQKVLDWMMAKDPNQRYPTPARAAQALQMFLSPSAEASALPRPAAAYGNDMAAPSPSPMVAPMPTAAARSPLPAQMPVATSAAPNPGIPTGRLESSRKDRAPDKRRDGATPGVRGAQSPPPIIDEQYDVEVVAAVPPPPEPKKRREGEPRSLFELDKRDWIMVSFGAGVVLLAVLIGLGLSRLMRGTPPATTTQSEQGDSHQPRYNPGPQRKDPSTTSKDLSSSKEPKIEDKKEMKQPDEKDKKPDDTKPEEKKPEEKKSEEKKPDDKKTEEKKPEEKKPDDKKSEEKKPEEKKPDDKKTEEKKDDAKDKKPEEKKTEPQ